MPRSAAADVPYPPRNHAITAVETPFGRDAHALSEYPWRLEPGSFERLISYAWVVYLRASKCGGAQGPAHEWACAFERAFALPYVNVVLHLFNRQHDAKLVEQVVGHLSVVHLTIENILEEHLHASPAAIVEEELVESWQPGVISPL